MTSAKAADADFVAQVDVQLGAGESVYAARDPIWFTEGLISSPVDGGLRWDSPGAGMLRFGTGDAANIAELNLGESALVVAMELVLLWTEDVRFDALDLPGITGFARASGAGRVWMIIPGYPAWWPYALLRAGSLPAALVINPARLVWMKDGTAPPEPVPGPGGQRWLRIAVAHAADLCLHTWSR